MNDQEPRESQSPSDQRRALEEKGSGHGVLITIIALLIVAGIIVAGVVPRLKARAALKTETTDLATPYVTVVQPKRGAPQQEIVLPGNIQAFTDAPIYARTNGYLRKWYSDIGAHVKAGQLLADIDTPEVDQQLQQARADLNTAQANAHLSALTAERYEGLKNTESVSKQDVDNATGDYEAKKAMVQSAQHNVDRLQQLQGFAKIYAPFDGVITARNTDIGALIDSGSSGGAARELFHIAATHELRVYINVPQAFSQVAKPGLTPVLTLTEFPGRRFQGKLVRTADSIDPSSRTLLVEVDVDNPRGELFPGAFAEVHLQIPTMTSTFIVPVSSLIFRSEGMQVATIEGDHAVLSRVSIGRDFGTEVEIISGLTGNEQIIDSPPDSLVSGEKVRVATPKQGADAK